MKNIVIVSLLMGLLINPVFAQENKPQEVLIKVEQVKAQSDKSNIEVANEYVEFGKNVGSAMREGLSALTDEANKFADTDAGHFTMAVIAYKVAGQDAIKLIDRFVGVIVGVPMLIVLWAYYIWFMRKSFICHKVCVERGPGFFIWRTKKYEIVNQSTDWRDDQGGVAFIATIVCFVGTALIIGVIIF